MEGQILLNIVLGVASGALGLLAVAFRDDMHNMMHDHRNLQQIVTNLREAIPQRYATTTDLQEAMERSERSTERIEATLQRIEEKVDRKVDRYDHTL